MKNALGNRSNQMKNDALGSRMKQNYEAPARHLLVRRMPVIVRVDGRAFHTLTRHFQKPFDQKFIDSMHVASIQLAGEMQGFKLGYIQSDEASFVLTDYDNLNTDAWFGYVKSKIESISAAMMTFAFARCMRLAGINDTVMFDARAFNIPEDEVVNYFLWRAKDWHRNSVSMYARAHFSHRELYKKRICDMHEMLHGAGRNWSTDLTDEEKNGTFIFSGDSSQSDIEPCFEEINALWERLNPTTSPDTTNKQAANESDSASSTTASGSSDGTIGSGI